MLRKNIFSLLLFSPQLVWVFFPVFLVFFLLFSHLFQPAPHLQDTLLPPSSELGMTKREGCSSFVKSVLPSLLLFSIREVRLSVIAVFFPHCRFPSLKTLHYSRASLPRHPDRLHRKREPGEDLKSASHFTLFFLPFSHLFQPAQQLLDTLLPPSSELGMTKRGGYAK